MSDMAAIISPKRPTHIRIISTIIHYPLADILINIFLLEVIMVSIIGGGPIGNYTAALLAQKGYEPTVYEEHDVIGKPIQCTGIATIYLGDILNTLTEKVPKDFTINIIN